MRITRKSRVFAALGLTALLALGLTMSAQAKLTGEFTRFANCPYKNEKAIKCIYAVTESGEVVLGSKKVPIVNPVILQGAYAEPAEVKEGAEFYPFLAATNGVTLSKSPQPVPGGLSGLVNCKEITEPFLRFSCELTFENGITGLNSTVELAKPASAIRISENNLAGEVGTALQLPIKFHLENPFLGSNCYVGSSTNPVIWNLTAGTTKPPAPNTPISGAGGEGEFLEEFQILKLKNNKLVDNSWAAPGATGCGGFLVELLLNPVVNAGSGLPAAAGRNTAIQKNTLYQAAAVTVLNNDVTHP
jgi:hypothetical protein